MEKQDGLIPDVAGRSGKAGQFCQDLRSAEAGVSDPEGASWRDNRESVPENLQDVTEWIRKYIERTAKDPERWYGG